MTSSTRRTLDGAGTSETRWRRWSQLDSFPLFDEPIPSDVVAVAPHPDDDVLGAGGLLRHAARAGSQIVTLAVTDGEASHPLSPTTRPGQLQEIRVAEAAAAHRRLGIRPASERLRLPDGDVASWRGELTERIALAVRPGGWCLAPWEGDGHPDHDATGAAARAACGAVGATLVSYLIWTWHWSHPADPQVPWERARRVALTRTDRARKRWAIRAYRSQIQALSGWPGDAAILPPSELSHHRRRAEFVLL
jgi:LmbE family N-acetylglucosaminyl deacetylase